MLHAWDLRHSDRGWGVEYGSLARPAETCPISLYSGIGRDVVGASIGADTLSAPLIREPIIYNVGYAGVLDVPTNGYGCYTLLQSEPK